MSFQFAGLLEITKSSRSILFSWEHELLRDIALTSEPAILKTFLRRRALCSAVHKREAALFYAFRSRGRMFLSFTLYLPPPPKAWIINLILSPIKSFAYFKLALNWPTYPSYGTYICNWRDLQLGLIFGLVFHFWKHLLLKIIVYLKPLYSLPPLSLAVSS